MSKKFEMFNSLLNPILKIQTQNQIHQGVANFRGVSLYRITNPLRGGWADHLAGTQDTRFNQSGIVPGPKGDKPKSAALGRQKGGEEVEPHGIKTKNLRQGANKFYF